MNTQNSEATRPRIGVTSGRSGVPVTEGELAAHYVGRAYVRAVVRAGGAPFVLPSVDEDVDVVAETALAGIDGLVLPGGCDLSPSLYGGEPDAALDADPVRDVFELAMLNGAIEREIPVLGHLPRDGTDQRRLRRDAAKRRQPRACQRHPRPRARAGARARRHGACRHPRQGGLWQRRGRSHLRPPSGSGRRRRRPRRLGAGGRRRHRGAREPRSAGLRGHLAPGVGPRPHANPSAGLRLGRRPGARARGDG